jgi:hypothetical protein
MCLWFWWSLQWPKPCKIDQMKMFGHLFNQAIVRMTWYGRAMFYYRTHTWANGESTHGPRDCKSLVHMSWYALWISQSLKDHIWTQLGLGHTSKQIYDKHKTIWWECVNVEKAMIMHDFIWHQNIAYLDWKHKKGSWWLHKNLVISIWSWVLHHLKHVFYFARS